MTVEEYIKMYPSFFILNFTKKALTSTQKYAAYYQFMIDNRPIVYRYMSEVQHE